VNTFYGLVVFSQVEHVIFRYARSEGYHWWTIYAKCQTESAWTNRRKRLHNFVDFRHETNGIAWFALFVIAPNQSQPRPP